MISSASGEITALLLSVRAGDARARDRLFTFAYGQICAIAHAVMKTERADHTLQPTALAHEIIGQLLASQNLQDVRDRQELFAAVVRGMRNFLIDHERKRAAEKRGGSLIRRPFRYASSVPDPRSPFAAIDWCDALEALAQVHKRASQITTLHFLWAMSMPEVAKHLAVSVGTVEKDWHLARAWLRRYFDRMGSSPGP